MSFSGKIKEELAEHSTDARHCNLAELSAIVQMCGHFSEDFKGRITLQVDTENYPVARKCFTLMRKTFNIKTDIVIRRHAGKDNWSYHLFWRGEELLAVKNADVQAVCCKRAYIRGAFLAAGSMSDPTKSYHLEIVCAQEERAEHLKTLMNSFGTDAKIVQRKLICMLYI